jgi:hypothetical protein
MKSDGASELSADVPHHASTIPATAPADDSTVASVSS